MEATERKITSFEDLDAWKYKLVDQIIRSARPSHDTFDALKEESFSGIRLVNGYIHYLQSQKEKDKDE